MIALAVVMWLVVWRLPASVGPAWRDRLSPEPQGTAPKKRKGNR
jgi:hypothetical protein